MIYKGRGNNSLSNQAQVFLPASRRTEGRIVSLCNLQFNEEAGKKSKHYWIKYCFLVPGVAPNIMRILFILILIILFPVSFANKEEKLNNKKENVYVAVSGGGFRSYNIATAVFAGMLDAVDNDIHRLSKNIKGFSGNSGGSWFLSHLLYSRKFNNALIKHRNEWFTSGYMHQLKERFKTENICEAYHGFYRKICRKFPALKTLFALSKINGVNPLDLDWLKAVEDTVFYPLGLAKELSAKKISSRKVNWAKNKDFSIAVSALTNNVKIEGSVFYNMHYTMTVNNEKAPFTIPVNLSSKVILPNYDLGLTYEVSLYSYPTQTYTASVPKGEEIDASKIPLIDAVSYSSSAVAGLSSADIGQLFEFQENALFTNMAPAVSLLHDDFRTIKPSELYKGKRIADNKVIRLADGGYNDNTSLSYLMHDIQRHDDKAYFKVLLIHNQTSDADVYTAMPFYKSGIQSEKYLGISVYGAKVFTPKIFKVLTKKKLFQWISSGLDITYKVYKVRTREDNYFNIKSGQYGEIHVFKVKTYNYADAQLGGLLPTHEKVFNTYQMEFNNIRRIVASDVWPHIKETLNVD